MQVYKLRLIMGKTPNYDESGKLKNRVIVSKYSGEKELTDILEDANYRKIGACEAKCVGVLDLPGKKENTARMAEVNKMISDSLKASEKPKTAIDLMKEQNELLKKQNEELKKGGDKTEDRQTLEDKANELKIQFSSRIGDVKLLERINEVEPEFKL